MPRRVGRGRAAPVSGAAGWRRSTPVPSATSASPSRRSARASSSARCGATGGPGVAPGGDCRRGGVSGYRAVGEREGVLRGPGGLVRGGSWRRWRIWHLGVAVWGLTYRVGSRGRCGWESGSVREGLRGCCGGVELSGGAEGVESCWGRWAYLEGESRGAIGGEVGAVHEEGPGGN